MVTGSLTLDMVEFDKKATVCKYVVPEGYPDESIKDTPIDIAAVKNKAFLYLSAVNVVDGCIHALGSRTAAYVGVADTISAAEKIAETEVCAIAGRLYHREDIGTERLIQQRVDSMRKLRLS
jgi:phosphoribosylamine--glycine ligase